MILSRTSSPEDIVRNTQGPESFITACDPPAHHQTQPAELSTQLDFGSNQHNVGIEQAMEVPEGVPSRFELRSLLLNELNFTGVTAMKGAMMQSIEETLANVLELGFQAANSGIKSVLFRSWRWL